MSGAHGRNSVTRAYLRTTMLERRRKVMVDWAAFLAGESAEAKVGSVFRNPRLEAGRARRGLEPRGW